MEPPAGWFGEKISFTCHSIGNRRRILSGLSHVRVEWADRMDSLRIKVLISGLLAAAALLVAAAVDTPGLAVGAVAAVLQLVFAYCWPNLTRCEGRWVLRVLLGLAGLFSTVAAVLLPGSPGMGNSVLVMMVGVLVTFVSQVFRGSQARGRLSNTVAGITGLAIVTQGAGLAALGASPQGFGIILVTVAALLGAGAAAITRLPDRVAMFLSLLLGAAIGAAASALPLGLHWYHSLLVGALAGLLVGSIRAVTVATRTVKTTTDMMAVASLILLVSGALSWYAMQILGRV